MMTARDILDEAMRRHQVHGSRPECGADVVEWYESTGGITVEDALYLLGFVIDVMDEENAS